MIILMAHVLLVTEISRQKYKYNIVNFRMTEIVNEIIDSLHTEYYNKLGNNIVK